MCHPDCSLIPHCHILVTAQDIKPWAQASIYYQAKCPRNREIDGPQKGGDLGLLQGQLCDPSAVQHLLMAPDVTSGRNATPTSVELFPQLEPARVSPHQTPPISPFSYFLFLPNKTAFIPWHFWRGTYYLPHFSEKSSEAQSSKPPTEDHSETNGSNGDWNLDTSNPQPSQSWPWIQS